MPVRLVDALTTTAPMAEIFSDRSFLQAALDFEIALARAEARMNIIPESAAEAIARVAAAASFDSAALAAATVPAATPAIPFVKALTEQIHAIDPGAASYVHWGATSQDVIDTALVLLLKKAWTHLRADFERVHQALQTLAEKHKDAVMLGRTLLQPAPPITFGLKAAGWLASISRAYKNLEVSFNGALVLQFGGASGTLAALEQKGLAVAQTLADELGIALPEAPWHTHRDRLAQMVCDCGILVGCLGKMAGDIALLAQNEVLEVAEPVMSGRGTSSTMPQKQNPAGCVVTRAAATRVPGLVSGFLSCMVQEHERAAGAWQAEWSIIPEVIGATALALASMADVAQGLTVNRERMRANIESTLGTIFAEKAMLLLTSALGRDTARNIVEQAARESMPSQRHLKDILSSNERVREAMGPALHELEDPQEYLGSAEEFRRRLLVSALRSEPDRKE